MTEISWGRRIVNLLATIWQKTVWCALIGAALGMAFGLLNSSEPRQDSIAFSICVDAFSGALLGVVLLGIPAALWVVAKWLFHGGKPTAISPAKGPAATNSASVVYDTVQDAGHGAMVGSAAAVPGLILGALVGAGGAALFLGVVLFISFMTGAPYYDDIVKHWLVLWFGVFTATGALLGVLGGVLLGGAVGAISGGFRGWSRHRVAHADASQRSD